MERLSIGKTSYIYILSYIVGFLNGLASMTKLIWLYAIFPFIVYMIKTAGLNKKTLKISMIIIYKKCRNGAIVVHGDFLIQQNRRVSGEDLGDVEDILAKDKPISRPMTQQFEENYDRIFGKIPLGESKKPKDWVKLGLSPSTIVEEISAKDLKG